MFWARSIFRWFNSLSYLLESPCSSLLVNWKILSVATIADDRDQSSKNSETWNGLPDVAIKKIFEKFNICHRTRMKLVSKSWNRILNRADIPTALEGPWLIASRDSCSTPRIFLTEIEIGAFEGTCYPFKLPKFYEDGDVPAGGCLCGTSNGWLVIAAGPNLRPDMFLWNPLSGITRKLPPLSTVPFVAGLRPELNDLPSFIKRVEVFSEEYCAVAVIFSHPWGDKEDCLALCTPEEKRWSIMKGNYYYSYDDILYHDGKLYALAQINNDEKEEEEEEEEKVIKANYTIYFSSRSNFFEVKVCVLRLKYKFNVSRWTRYDEADELIHRTFSITHANAFCEHLVECSITGKLMVAAAIFDSYKYNSNGDGPVEPFTCEKTSVFEVRMVETLERVHSIGEQVLFISSMSSLSLPASAQETFGADSIMFLTDDAQGLVGDQQDCIVARETGHFSMQLNSSMPSADYLRYPVQSKMGWLKPKIS